MGRALPFLQKLSFNFYAFVAILISKECIEPLGMQSGEIKDYQITASSSRPADLPQYGRLHNGKYWCAAKKSKNEYFQVDLGQVCKISRVYCTFCLNVLFDECHGLPIRWTVYVVPEKPEFL